MASLHGVQRTFLEVLHTTPLSRDLRDFLLDVSAADRTANTLLFYRQKLTPFLDYLRDQGVEGAQDLSPSHIRGFMSTLSRSHSPGGCHAHWRAVRAFVRFLVREGILTRNPLSCVRAPKVDQDLLEPVTLDVVKALLSTCDKTGAGLRDRSLILALLDTGLRAGEAIALNVGDLDLTDGAIDDCTDEELREIVNDGIRQLQHEGRIRRANGVWVLGRNLGNASTAEIADVGQFIALVNELEATEDETHPSLAPGPTAHRPRR